MLELFVTSSENGWREANEALTALTSGQVLSLGQRASGATGEWGIASNVSAWTPSGHFIGSNLSYGILVTPDFRCLVTGKIFAAQAP